MNFYCIPGHRYETRIVARYQAQLQQPDDIPVDVAVVALKVSGERVDGHRP